MTGVASTGARATHDRGKTPSGESQFRPAAPPDRSLAFLIDPAVVWRITSLETLPKRSIDVKSGVPLKLLLLLVPAAADAASKWIQMFLARGVDSAKVFRLR